MVMPSKISESVREYLYPIARQKGFQKEAQTKMRAIKKIVLLFFTFLYPKCCGLR